MDKKTKVDNTKYDFVFIRKHYHIFIDNKRSAINAPLVDWLEFFY